MHNSLLELRSLCYGSGVVRMGLHDSWMGISDAPREPEPAQRWQGSRCVYSQRTRRCQRVIRAPGLVPRKAEQAN